jgi:hypothetical protein
LSRRHLLRGGQRDVGGDLYGVCARYLLAAGECDDDGDVRLLLARSLLAGCRCDLLRDLPHLRDRVRVPERYLDGVRGRYLLAAAGRLSLLAVRQRSVLPRLGCWAARLPAWILLSVGELGADRLPVRHLLDPAGKCDRAVQLHSVPSRYVLDAAECDEREYLHHLPERHLLGVARCELTG